MSYFPSEDHTSDDELSVYGVPQKSYFLCEKGKLSFGNFIDGLELVDVEEQDLDYLVLNFLLTNMHEETAKNFIEECGNKGATQLMEILSQRIKVRNAVLEGRTWDAVEIVNSISVTILQENIDILFILLSSNLLDYIKKGDMFEAVKYAREVLSPLVMKSNKLVENLEEIMSLFSFPDVNSPDALKVLSKTKKPHETAKMLDVAIMKYFKLSSKTVLEKLVKEAKWLEQKLVTDLRWTGFKLKNLERMEFAKHDRN